MGDPAREDGTIASTWHLTGRSIITAAPLSIDTAGGNMARRTWDPGRWPSADRTRPKVLVESSDAADSWAVEMTLDLAGYEVAVCTGQSERGAPCPLVQQGDCELATGADVILNHLPLTEPTNREILRMVRARVPETPVIVEAGLRERERHADLLAGCRVVPAPLTTRGLLDVVWDESTDAAGSIAHGRSNGQTGG